MTTATAALCTLQDVLRWRDSYRQEMNCQIIHDSIHVRDGWTREYLLRLGGTPVGYGSVAVAGPWKDKPTIYEIHVAPPARSRLFDLFDALLAASGAAAIETQSNDPTLGVLIHAFARTVASESILFHDRLTTHHPQPHNAIFRPATPEDVAQIKENGLDEGAGWLLEVDGTIAATGGVLFHYNRPYGDIYMSVAEPCRRRGLGSYLVQELKRICYERGDVPAARCNLTNPPSRRTLQKAGFVPCGHILVGDLAGPAPS
ncbi:MAG TPA: GNAT family N-acetyltransferase [Tepidisphaeraceae bacterium]|jgi:GNAT superfamily N-acetyltransferase